MRYTAVRRAESGPPTEPLLLLFQGTGVFALEASSGDTPLAGLSYLKSWRRRHMQALQIQTPASA